MPIQGTTNTVQGKNIYFLTNNGRVAKGHVGERTTYLEEDDEKIDDVEAYNKVIASEHPGLVPPFTLGNDQYVLFASAGSLDEFPLTVAQAKIGFLQNLDQHANSSLVSDVVANLLQRAIYYFDTQLQLHPEIQAKDMDTFATQLGLTL